MGIRSGFGAIEKSLEKQDSGGSRGQGTTFVTWSGKDGPSKNKKIIRFLDSEPRVIGMYSFLKCKDGKNRDFPNTEELSDPRPDVIPSNFTREGRDGKQIPVRASDQGLALAAIREEVKNPNGKGVVYQDVLQDVEVSDEEKLEKVKELAEKGVIELDGNTVKGIPTVGIVKQSLGNFWKTLNGYWSRYETISDRDYEISRSGERLDTDYTIIPADKDEDLSSEEQLQERYAIAMFLHPTVDEWLNRMGSKERFEFHLFGEEDGKDAGGEEVQEQESRDKPAPQTNSSLSDQLSTLLGKK